MWRLAVLREHGDISMRYMASVVARACRQIATIYGGALIYAREHTANTISCGTCCRVSSAPPS